MELAKKLTLQSMNKVRGGFKNVTEPRFVGRIIGIAHNAEAKTTAIGDYWEFSGEFEGTNSDGEIIVAPVCMLPEPAASSLATMVGEGGAVKFGFDFHVHPRGDIPIGYEFVTKPLLELKPSSLLADMKASIPALPAPKSTQAALPDVPQVTHSETTCIPGLSIRMADPMTSLPRRAAAR